MKKSLEKAINLARITKDKIIVVDEEAGGSFVVIDLAEYEKLMLGIDKKEDIKNLTENELLDKINRDIAFWKEENEIKEVEEEKLASNTEEDVNFFGNNEEDLDEEVEEDNLYYYEESEIKDNINISDRKNDWEISPDIKQGAEDIK